MTSAPTGPVGAAGPAGSAAEIRPRRAFVFGGGGVLGYAWTIGALSAIEELLEVDALDSDVVVGTSAGSVLAALLSCGISTAELVRHHQGTPAPGDLKIDWDYDTITGGSLPPRPSLRPGSPRLLLSALRHPRRVGPWVGLSAALPTGRGSLEPIRAAIAAAISITSQRPGRPAGAGWPAPWIVATDYRSGARVVFGRDVPADLPTAVVASCAIPAWYAPVMIGTSRYIDGGTVSNTSADLLVGQRFDEVYVLAPGASFQDVEPGRTRGERLERWIRAAVTRSVRAEVHRLRAGGGRVLTVTATTDDLALIGVNLMNPARRREVLDTARETAIAQLRAQLAWPR